MSKVYIVWAKKVQRSYLSWHWKVIQNLERHRFVVLKLTLGIWQILTWALESLKNFTLMGSFWTKHILFELKKYRGVVFHDTEEWCKIWRKTGLLLGKFTRNWLAVLKLTWTSQILTRALEKSKKLFCFNWLLVTKVYIVWATKVQRSYLSWHWRVMHILKKNWLVVWNRQFGKFSPEHLKLSKLGPWWDPFVQSRKVMTLKFIEELCVMAMKNNTKFKEELNC